MVLAVLPGANAQVAPVLTWITNSSVKVEQIIGEVDWADWANGLTNFTASQTVTRFRILGNGHGYSFEDQGKLIFLFGDTISENTTNWDYHAHDPLAWCVNKDGESGLVLRRSEKSHFWAINCRCHLRSVSGWTSDSFAFRYPARDCRVTAL